MKVRKITMHYHRPPNNPRWKVEVCLPDGRMKELWPYAPDEMSAYASAVRWWRRMARPYHASA